MCQTGTVQRGTVSQTGTVHSGTLSQTSHSRKPSWYLPPCRLLTTELLPLDLTVGASRTDLSKMSLLYQFLAVLELVPPPSSEQPLASDFVVCEMNARRQVVVAGCFHSVCRRKDVGCGDPLGVAAKVPFGLLD